MTLHVLQGEIFASPNVQKHNIRDNFRSKTPEYAKKRRAF